MVGGPSRRRRHGLELVLALYNVWLAVGAAGPDNRSTQRLDAKGVIASVDDYDTSGALNPGPGASVTQGFYRQAKSMCQVGKWRGWNSVEKRAEVYSCRDKPTSTDHVPDDCFQIVGVDRDRVPSCGVSFRHREILRNPTDHVAIRTQCRDEIRDKTAIDYPTIAWECLWRNGSTGWAGEDCANPDDQA